MHVTQIFKDVYIVNGLKFILRLFLMMIPKKVSWKLYKKVTDIQIIMKIKIK